MRNREKVAVTVDPALLERIERMRKRTGESRSAVFERALEAYVATSARTETARRYADGYRRRPETDADVRASLATALDALASEPYDASR